MKKKTYTIFGHNGFIGSILKEKLKNNKLILPSRGQTIFRYHLGDIIYCIGSDLWKKDYYNSYYANLGYLPEIVKKNKFNSFNFLSSARIYKNSNFGDVNNFLKVNPADNDDYFNIKKVCAESFLINCNKKIKILRLGNLYGNNYKAPILLPTLIRNAINKKLINITINKKSLKDYLNVDDATNIIIKIIKSGKKNIYNIASGERTSLQSIANKIKKITNCRIKYSNQKNLKNEAKIDISQIRKEFKFQPKSYLLSDIEKLVKDYLNR